MKIEGNDLLYISLRDETRYQLNIALIFHHKQEILTGHAGVQTVVGSSKENKRWPHYYYTVVFLDCEWPEQVFVKLRSIQYGT